MNLSRINIPIFSNRVVYFMMPGIAYLCFLCAFVPWAFYGDACLQSFLPLAELLGAAFRHRVAGATAIGGLARALPHLCAIGTPRTLLRTILA